MSGLGLTIELSYCIGKNCKTLKKGRQKGAESESRRAQEEGEEGIGIFR